MYKVFVEKKGVNFEKIEINKDNLSSECGLSFPYDGHYSDEITGIAVDAKDVILKISARDSQGFYELGTFQIIK